jgi:GYF domain 2
MNWYYVEAGQQVGPVDDAGLDALVATGKITSETLVWRDGMANWTAYGAARPAAMGGPGVIPGGEAVCAECGQMFPVNDTIQIGGARVCANCKPVFVQKMREGVSTQPTGTSAYVTEDQALARDYHLDIGRSLERGWGAFTANAGIMVATALVLGILLVVVGTIGRIANSIVPLSSSVISILTWPALSAGFALFALKALRGETVGVGDGFSGFGPRYWQLVLMGLVQFLINMVCAVPGAIVAALMVAGSAAAIRSGGARALMGGAMVGVVLAVLLIVVLLVIVNSLWLFAPLLIMDKGYDFWPAMQLSRRMVAKRLGGTILFYFVAWILNVLGVCACLVGTLVTAPLYMNMKAVVFEDNFRDLAPRR